MMEKEIQRKKKVLIDLTNYGSLTAGFGQIAANYAAAFSSMYNRQIKKFPTEKQNVSLKHILT